ncbi:MAG: transporter substrate-binding domain-containing protein, partial [Reinekea sp.]
VRRSRAVLNQFLAKTTVMAIKLDLIPHASDGHNSFVRTPSLNWPPFTSPSIAGGGMSSVIVKEALGHEGYKVNVEFESWGDAIARAEQTDEVAGYFPAYYSEARVSKCLFSDVIGTSMVGFAVRKGERYDTSITGLSDRTVGVVSDYANEDQFDKAVAEGKIPVLESPDDVKNMQQLLEGNVDLAVIDNRVMNYLMVNDSVLSSYRTKVKFDPRGLKMHGLYVCFTGPKSEEYAAALARGLKALDPMGFGLANDPMYKDQLKK